MGKNTAAVLYICHRTGGPYKKLIELRYFFCFTDVMVELSIMARCSE